MTRSLLTAALFLQAIAGCRAAPCQGTRIRPTRTVTETVSVQPTSQADAIVIPTPDVLSSSIIREEVPTTFVQDEVPASIIRDVVPTSLFESPSATLAPRPTQEAGLSPVTAALGPATYTANPDVGPGGSDFTDSAHFRIYGNSGAAADEAISHLEGAYECFVGTLGFRSSGLSYNQNNDDGPWFKTNIYSVPALTGAAGVMHADMEAGLAYVEVVHEYLANPGVTVHEYGHALHYHQQTWVHQGRTGAWWETFANWFADTYKTSDLCAAARANNGQSAPMSTDIELRKVIGDSFQVLVDGSVGTGNYYQAWPFFTYLTNNPDELPGLGTDALRNLMVQYAPNSNETPLHTLARVSEASVADIVGLYWAHMAYVDIGHASAHDAFLRDRARLNYDNVDASGTTYTVKAARRPQYMGANITPLTTTGGTVAVELTAGAGHRAHLAIYGDAGQTRYVAVDGSAEVEIAAGEEISLVVANTPEELVLYDPFELTADVTRGLEYSFTLSGATA